MNNLALSKAKPDNLLLQQSQKQDQISRLLIIHPPRTITFLIDDNTFKWIIQAGLIINTTFLFGVSCERHEKIQENVEKYINPHYITAVHILEKISCASRCKFKEKLESFFIPSISWHC